MLLGRLYNYGTTVTALLFSRPGLICQNDRFHIKSLPNGPSSATITKPGQKLIQFGAITGSAKENPTDFESPEI